MDDVEDMAGLTENNGFSYNSPSFKQKSHSSL